MPFESVFTWPLDTVISLETSRLKEHFRRFYLIHDAIAASVLAFPHGQFDWSKPQNSLLRGRTDLAIRVPTIVFLPSALRNEPPPPVELVLTKVPIASENDGTGVPNLDITRWTSIYVDAAVAAFVLYCEAHIDHVKTRYGQISAFPPRWGFGRVVRNALAHGGEIEIRDAKFAPVSWQGLTYGPAQNGLRVIGVDLHAPDLLLLMIDMDIELGAVTPST